MSEIESTTEATVAVAKELGKVIAKTTVITAAETVAAIAVLATVGFAAQKWQERKAKKSTSVIIAD